MQLKIRSATTIKYHQDNPSLVPQDISIYIPARILTTPYERTLELARKYSKDKQITDPNGIPQHFRG